eukprot:7094446-Prorocentrum_lima.AAC.1
MELAGAISRIRLFGLISAGCGYTYRVEITNSCRIPDTASQSALIRQRAAFKTSRRSRISVAQDEMAIL